MPPSASFASYVNSDTSVTLIALEANLYILLAAVDFLSCQGCPCDSCNVSQILSKLIEDLLCFSEHAYRTAGQTWHKAPLVQPTAQRLGCRAADNGALPGRRLPQ